MDRYIVRNPARQLESQIARRYIQPGSLKARWLDRYTARQLDSHEDRYINSRQLDKKKVSQLGSQETTK
jgi:hypothetical protein